MYVYTEHMDQGMYAAILNEVPFGIILWGVLGLMIVVFCIFSAILLWHWKVYSTGRFTTVATMFTYLGVSGGLLALMALSAMWFTLA